MSQKDYEEVLRLMHKRSCGNCKFYDGLCCMYNCACKAILHEDKTAEKCVQFISGEYNQDDLEKTNYR
jgi:hypothetical protein